MDKALICPYCGFKQSYELPDRVDGEISRRPKIVRCGNEVNGCLQYFAVNFAGEVFHFPASTPEEKENFISMQGATREDRLKSYLFQKQKFIEQSLPPERSKSDNDKN